MELYGIVAFKDSLRKSTPSNKTQMFIKSMNMDIWIIVLLSRLFLRGSYVILKLSLSLVWKCCPFNQYSQLKTVLQFLKTVLEISSKSPVTLT